MMPASKPRPFDLHTAERFAAAGRMLILLVLLAAILANSMTKQPVSRDEHMYCTAAVLLARGQAIYRDFAYPAQLPYHPLLLGTLCRALHTEHYLLVGRLLSAFCDMAVVVLILAIYRRAFDNHRLAGQWLGLAGAVLYAFNPLVDYAAGYAWNHDVVIACVVLSFWVFARTGFRPAPPFWRIAAMGALLTFATGMRVTTALVVVVFLAAVLAAAGGSIYNRIRTALPFAVASLLVLAWPLWIVMQAPKAAWLNLVEIPALYGRWLHEIGLVFNKAGLTIDCLKTPGYLALLIVAGYSIAVAVRRRASLGDASRRNLLLAGGVVVCFCLIAFIPPTMWHQYWAVPVPFLVIVCAYPMAALRQAAQKPDGRRSFRVARAVTFSCATLAILTNLTVLRRLPAVIVPEYWTPVMLHRTAVDIAGRVGEPKLVLTLGPLYALEGGSDIYPELASGSIVYRAADMMSAEDRAITPTVGPATLKDLLNRKPPSAAFLGVEPSYLSFLEEPLLQALDPAWPRHSREDGLQVYVRP